MNKASTVVFYLFQYNTPTFALVQSNSGGGGGGSSAANAHSTARASPSGSVNAGKGSGAFLAIIERLGFIETHNRVWAKRRKKIFIVFIITITFTIYKNKITK